MNIGKHGCIGDVSLLVSNVQVKQEAQLMLTNRATHLEVSQGHLT